MYIDMWGCYVMPFIMYVKTCCSVLLVHCYAIKIDVITVV